MSDVTVFTMHNGPTRYLGDVGVVEWTPGIWWAVQVTGQDGSFTPLHMGKSKDDAIAWASRQQFLHSVFVTALEGGIGYWSRCKTYRWSHGGKSQVEDVVGFKAEVFEEVDEETTVEHVIDAAVIERGIKLLAQGKATYGGEPMSEKAQALYAGIEATDDADMRVDSDLADNIVQAGLFNDVRYG